MRADVFIKTWYGDLCWISYALRFLERNWVEPDSNIIVLANSDCRKIIETWGFSSRVKYFYVDPWPDSNQFQGYLTLSLADYSDADIFVIFDSDTMLLEPIRLTDCLQDGDPIIWYLPYSDANPVYERMWGPIMERWLGVVPQSDFMQRWPFVYRSSTLANVRRMITSRTRYGVRESLHSSVPYRPENFNHHPFKFCEHNVIGFYCSIHEPDRYKIRDVRTQERNPVRQYHSWSDWGPHRIAELDQLLAEGYHPETKCQSKSGWTVLANDVRDGHSSLVLQFDRIDIDVGLLPTYDFVRPYIKPGTTLIDVGAHIGNFSVPSMRMLGPKGLVVSYEPHPYIFECLKANVAKERGENPQAAQCITMNDALGETTRAGVLFCSPTNFASNTILSGIIGPETGVDINVDTLDRAIDLEQEICFIKIDVEGGELSVLKGGETLLKRWHPAIFMETSESFLTQQMEQGLFDYLRSLGYQRFIPFPQDWVDKGYHAHDVLALP